MTKSQSSDEDDRYPKIDALKIYFSEPYQLKEKIVITQPTIGQILDYGETKFYAMLRIFIQTTTSFKVPLWDMGIDWNDISDWELFRSMVTSLEKDKTQILFGDLDFTLFKTYSHKIPNPNFDEEEEESEKNPRVIEDVFLYDPINDIEIDESDYKQMALYLRTVFNIFPETKYCKTKFFREDIINDEKERIEQEKKNQKTDSTLLPIISACVNHPGFKYKISELKDIGINAFMDSVQRLQIYESSTALLKGMYSGFIDTKGIDPTQFNFMRELK